MPKNDETNASGQAGACDCTQCRIAAAFIEARPKNPTSEERKLILGALVYALAWEIAQHPKTPTDALLMEAQLDLVVQTMNIIAGSQHTQH